MIEYVGLCSENSALGLESTTRVSFLVMVVVAVVITIRKGKGPREVFLLAQGHTADSPRAGVQPGEAQRNPVAALPPPFPLLYVSRKWVISASKVPPGMRM